MITSDSLSRATLDTLPFNVAVLDGDGTILFTNRSWKEFGESSEMVGEDYFENVDLTDGDTAREAVDGIRSVIDGETEVFTLEYPCHTPSEDQWFLMRVSALPAEADGAVAVAHIDITQRKRAELAAERRADQLAAERRNLEHLLDRLDGLVQEVMAALAGADSRTEIERAVCDRLTAVSPYVLAWIGHEQPVSGELVASEWAGADLLPEGASIPLDGGPDDPTRRAVRTREFQAVQDVAALPDSSLHRAVSGENPGAVAAIPLTDNDAFYGVLHVYASETDVFDEREKAVLNALGTAISAAINARESRRLLTADLVTELEFEVPDGPAFFLALSDRLDRALEYHGSVQRADGTTVMFFDVTDADPKAVFAFADGRADLREVTHLTDHTDAARFEFVVSDPPVVSLLADYGGEIKAMTVDGGRATVRAELPSTVDVREVIERLEDTHGAELHAYREAERPGRTKREFLAALTDQLTDRQTMALRKAFVGGFFEWPRDVSGEELADSMGVSPATFYQHLRAAERKLVESVFEE